MNITFVTSAQTDEEGYALLKEFGLPFKTLKKIDNMAKESMKAREVRRAKLVAKYAEKRAALKQIVRTGDLAEAFEAAQKLQELPKNSNPIRMHNRCKLTGRPKGYIRQFGISRIQFREMASNGLIPGIKKASW